MESYSQVKCLFLIISYVLTCSMVGCDTLLGQWLQMSQDRCVKFSQNRENWDRGRESCRQQGAEMLSMRSLEELNWVTQVMDTYMVGLYKLNFWIGLKRGNSSDVNFHWADGSKNMDAANHIQWFFDQPNYRPHLCTPDDCVRYGQVWYSFFGAWDATCTSRLRYICSKDQCTTGVDPRETLCTPDGLLDDEKVCVHYRTRHQFIFQDSVLKCRGMMNPDHRPHRFSESDLMKFANWVGAQQLSNDIWIAMENTDTSRGCPYLRDGVFYRNGTCLTRKNYVCPQPYSEFWASSNDANTVNVGNRLPPLGSQACAQKGHPLKSKNSAPFYVMFFILGAIISVFFAIGFMKFFPQIRNLVPGSSASPPKPPPAAQTPDPGFSNPTYD